MTPGGQRSDRNWLVGISDDSFSAIYEAERLFVRRYAFWAAQRLEI